MIAVVAVGLLPNLSADPTEPMATITAFIASTAKGDIAHGSTAYQTIFAVGMTLFVMTFVMNLIAIRFVRRFRQEYE
jgi:phosphate transport system permease protein